MIMFFLLSSDVASAEPEVRLKERFLQEAPLQWQEYEAFMERVQGTILFKNYLDGELVQDRRYEFKQNTNCKMGLNQSFTKDEEDGELSAYNQSYAFTLRRALADRPWALALLKHQDRKENHSTEPIENIRLIRRDFEMLYPLMHVCSKPLRQLVQSPHFQVREIKLMNRDGEELVQLDFSNTHPVGSGDTPIQQGTLFLDPSRFWCIRSSAIQRVLKDVTSWTKMENTIADLSAKHPLPKRSIETTEFSYHKGYKGSRVNIFESDCDLKEPSNLPDDKEFTLSAFGLHEPFGSDKRPTRRFLWVALAGFICLAVAALFRWLARRAAKAKAVP